MLLPEPWQSVTDTRHSAVCLSSSVLYSFFPVPCLCCSLHHMLWICSIQGNSLANPQWNEHQFNSSLLLCLCFDLKVINANLGLLIALVFSNHPLLLLKLSFLDWCPVPSGRGCTVGWKAVVPQVVYLYSSQVGKERPNCLLKVSPRSWFLRDLGVQGEESQKKTGWESWMC